MSPKNRPRTDRRRRRKQRHELLQFAWTGQIVWAGLVVKEIAGGARSANPATGAVVRRQGSTTANRLYYSRAMVAAPHRRRPCRRMIRRHRLGGLTTAGNGPLSPCPPHPLRRRASRTRQPVGRIPRRQPQRAAVLDHGRRQCLAVAEERHRHPARRQQGLHRVARDGS